MRFWLEVRDLSAGLRRSYYIDCPGIEVVLNRGDHVEVPYSRALSAAGEGLGMTVDRCYFDIPQKRVSVRLEEVIIDPPEGWRGQIPRTMCWRTAVEEVSGEQFRANLVAGGWQAV